MTKTKIIILNIDIFIEIFDNNSFQLITNILELTF